MSGFLKKKYSILITILAITSIVFFLKSGAFAANSRNNNNFINDSFWRGNPTNTQIKEAIFGNATDTKTAYTQERSANPCSTGTINIVNVENYTTSGINSLPVTLAANTIYVLNSGTYISSGQTNYNGNCIAVIGKGIVKKYSNIALTSGTTSTCMFKSNGKQYLVLSDIWIDGLQDGLGNYRSAGNTASGNSYGVYFYNTKNANIHGISTFNNRYGMQIEMAEYNVVSDVVAYNNYVQGIYIYGSSKPNYITNTQIFNNNGNGLLIKLSTGQIISNTQTYNNKARGIQFESVNNTVISNCMSYNNYSYGLNLLTNSSNNMLNNSWFYNNGTTGVIVQSGINNKYYGSMKSFNNITNDAANILVGITAGSSGDTAISGLGRTDGVLDTGLNIGYAYITNPRTNDGRDLISSTHRSSTNRSSKGRTGVEFISFAYGTGLLKQARNITYGTPSNATSNSFYDSNKYIAYIDFANTNPDGFTFINITGASLNQVYTSNTITLAGMDAGTFAYLSINGRGSIVKNGTDIGSTGTGSNGDELAIKITSSNNYYYLRSGNLAIGSTSADFTITTEEQVIDNVPDNFSFTDITNANLNQTYTSNTITLTEMDPAAEISISLTGRGTIFKNGINIGTWGTGKNGDQFYIQMTSSSNYYTTRNSSFLAHNVSENFSITTLQDLVFPTFGGVISGTTYDEPLNITFSDNNLSGATLNGNIYTNGTQISAEGDYIFEVSDTAGNTTGATFRISIPKTITITFDSNISTGTVSKAAVKYNKDVAYGMVYDDGLDDGYQPAFKYLNGGQISGWNTNFIAPGLYYTDGAGNDIAFRGGYAWYSVNSAFSDLHINTPSYIKWSELKETYLNGRDIVNHGRSSSAYPADGQTYNYPDNPPGTTGLDYAYEIQKNYEYVRDRIGLSGVSLTHFILPSGDQSYTQPARDQGYKSVSAQGIGIGVNGINIYPTIDLNHFQMNRKYTTSQNSDFSNVKNDIDTLMTNSMNSTTKLWRHAFTHGIVFTGNNNGGMNFDLWKYLMDHIANTYGKNGSDRIWFAGPQEVYEYVTMKQGTNINTVISGNQMIINLDTLNVPSNLRRKALSLLITGTNTNISSITYQNGAFTYHSDNKNNGLINIEMGDYYLTDRNPDTFNLGTQIDANPGQAYNSSTITLTGMSPELNNIIYLSGAGTLYKNGTNVGTSSTGKNGDQFYIRLTASTIEGATTLTTLNIGLQSQTYSITTHITPPSSDDDIIDIPSGNNKSSNENQLIASGYISGTGSIKSNQVSFLVGKKKIRTRDSAGKILAAVIMQSSEASNIIEAQIPEGTIVKNGNNDAYVGILDIPTAIPTNSIALSNVIYAASFGSTGDALNFEDDSNAPVHVTIRMPAPGKSNGDSVSIYYSQNNRDTWDFHTNTTVISFNSQTYVEFTTTHFTDFAILSSTGTFVINGDAAATTSNTVSLDINAPGALNMRFSDDNSIRSSWESYATTKSWTLPGTYGTKTVYAEFDTDGNTSSVEASTSDSINYSDPGVGGCGGGGVGEACITLQLTNGDLSCTYPTAVSMGSAGISNTTGTMAGDTWTNNLVCTDNSAEARPANITLQATTVLTNGSYTIANSNIAIDATAGVKSITAGGANCLSAIVAGTLTGTLDSAIAILKKPTAGSAEVCSFTYAASQIHLTVTIPAYQAAGSYTGTLTISIPNI